MSGPPRSGVPLWFSTLLTKRAVFVSYHHAGNQFYYNEFSARFADDYNFIRDNSLRQAIESDDPEYVRRQIRERYITGTSCTIVLCGLMTWGRKYVDWEIAATLDKEHGLIGVKLPELLVINNGCLKPDRLQDNIDSGYAVWTSWEYLTNTPAALPLLVNQAIARRANLMSNSRLLRVYNAPV